MDARNIEVALPLGDDVQLQQLNMSLGGHNDVQNLQSAAALTSLHMLPEQLHQLRWPKSLQKLQSLDFTDSSVEVRASSGLPYEDMLVDELPFAWQHYTNLTTLRVPGTSFQEGLPLWLAKLQHLRVLDLPRATSNDLFSVIVQLTQLEFLELDYLDAPLTDQIPTFAEFPALHYLNFGCLYYSSEQEQTYTCRFPEDEMKHIHQLELTVKTRSKMLERVKSPAEDPSFEPAHIFTFAAPTRSMMAQR